MKLFLISQSENDGYDTYDSAVVCAPDEETARRMHPGGKPDDYWDGLCNKGWADWCSTPERVMVKYLGEAAPETKLGIVCASFSAG